MTNASHTAASLHPGITRRKVAFSSRSALAATTRTRASLSVVHASDSKISRGSSSRRAAAAEARGRRTARWLQPQQQQRRQRDTFRRHNFVCIFFMPRCRSVRSFFSPALRSKTLTKQHTVIPLDRSCNFPHGICRVRCKVHRSFVSGLILKSDFKYLLMYCKRIPY